MPPSCLSRDKELDWLPNFRGKQGVVFSAYDRSNSPVWPINDLPGERSLSSTSAFLFKKWYLDCVSEEGTAIFGYAAELKWKALSLCYTNIFERSNDGKTCSRSSFRRHEFPQRNGQDIRWSSEPIGIDAQWNGLQDPIEREIYRDERGSVLWSCIAPLAHARISLVNSSPLRGLGYGECLSLTVPPWRLPLSSLRWGRFLSGNDSVVWIDWQGSGHFALLFHNAKEIHGARINDSDITGGGCIHLSLSRPALLRSGRTVSEALSRIRGVSSMFPSKILRLHESKWLSRGELRVDGKTCGNGWAIHELVRFQ